MNHGQDYSTDLKELRRRGDYKTVSQLPLLITKCVDGRHFH